MLSMALVPHTPQAVAESLCVALDPLMTLHGFAAGQPGCSTSTVGVVYCSEHGDFRRRFPALAPDIGYPDDGACTDLNVHIDLDNPARLREVQLDGHGLEELARDAQRDDLQEHIGRLYAVPLGEAIPLLNEVMTAILSTASEASPSERDGPPSPS